MYLKYKLLFLGFLLSSLSSFAYQVNIDSLLETSPNSSLHKKIDNRQDSIVKYFPDINLTSINNQVNDIQIYVEIKNIDKFKKYTYLNYLYSFLINIDKPVAQNFFNSGRYKACLEFFPAIIDYNEQGRLLDLLNQNKLLALKSIRFYRNDPTAKIFLEEYSDENPDEILRNIDEFSDASYVNEILLKLTAYSPLSAERYLGGFNTINRILKTNDNPIAKAVVKLDSTKTNRHVNFLFLNEVVKNNAIPVFTNTIQNNKITYLKELSKIHFDKNAIGKYSIDREISLLSADIIRELNYYYSNGYKNNVNSILSSFTNEELYLIFIYGYQNANTFSFSAYLQLIKEKSSSLYTKDFYQSITKVELANFIKTAEQFNKTNEILAITEESYKPNLLALISSDEEAKTDFSTYLNSFFNDLTQTHGIYNASAKTNTLPDSKIDLKKIDSELSSNSQLKIPSDVNIIIKKDEIISINKSDNIQLSLTPTIEKEIKQIKVPIIIRIRQDEKYTYEILRNIDNTIGNINYASTFLDKKYSKSVLNTVAEMHPDDIFRQVKNIQSKYWVKEILENATKQSPLAYKKYLPNENHPVRYILNNSTDSTILKINDLYKTFGYKSNVYSFINEIVKSNTSCIRLDSISKDKNAAFKEMMSIITQKNCLGKYSIEKELENNSLYTVRTINDIVASSDDIKYSVVKDYSSEELYVLMIYGEDELFNTSFNGIYSRFKSRLAGRNTYEFLSSIDYLHFRTFLKILANFNKTEDFLNGMTADQRLQLISKLVKNLELEKYNPSEVIYVAEAIPGFKIMNDRAVINTMIRKEFERLQADNSGTGMLMYGLLASIIEKDAVAEVDWYKEIKTNFELPNIDRINIAELKVNNIVVQQHFFYNDDDGKSSYSNFISTFKSMTNWEIIPHETYVQINSTSGNKVIVLANKPEYEQNGMNDIQKFISTNQYIVSVVVHRGHSFHTEKTLSVIPSSTKLLIVGSCGGYYKLPIAIERAPDAHIISTKQIGTMRVNDPIIKNVCENIRLSKDIIWTDFWTMIENATSKTAMFYDYVPPNKNLGSLFLNAYYKAIDKSIQIE